MNIDEFRKAAGVVALAIDLARLERSRGPRVRPVEEVIPDAIQLIKAADAEIKAAGRADWHDEVARELARELIGPDHDV